MPHCGDILLEGCYLRLLPLDEPLRNEPDEPDELERLDDDELDDDERDDDIEEPELRLLDEDEPLR
jgi:hypothetical protein